MFKVKVTWELACQVRLRGVYVRDWSDIVSDTSVKSLLSGPYMFGLPSQPRIMYLKVVKRDELLRPHAGVRGGEP